MQFTKWVHSFFFFFCKKKAVLAFNQLAFCNKAATIIRPENKEKSIHQRKSASLDQKSLEDGKIYNSTSKQCSNLAGKYYLKEKKVFLFLEKSFCQCFQQPIFLEIIF